MPYARQDSVRLFYTDSGAGDPPLLFVHGWCCDHSFWRRQLPAFRRRHRVVAVDLRGHGRSSKPRQEYTIDLFCRDLEWLIGQLGLRRPVVVGHSMGGVIALHLGARRRRALAAVVMVDSPVFPRFTREQRQQLAAFLQALASPAYREAARLFIENYFFLPTTAKELRAWIRDRMLAAPQHVMESAMRNLWLDNQRAAAALRAPALLVDAGGELADYDQLQAAIPSLQIGRTVGSGHFLQLEAPEQFNAMLSTFIDQLGSARK